MHLRPRVEIFCFRGPRVLAGFNAEENYVLFPGGGIDPGESAIEAAKRECAEEASRRLVNCTVASPPSVQLWPKGYKKGEYDGSLTYWMTGSVSDEALPELNHTDYESSLAWRAIPLVLAELRRTLGNGWDDDNRVRITILETQQKMRRPVKFAEILALA